MEKRKIFWIDDEIPTTMKFIITDFELRGYEIEKAMYIKDTLEKLDEFEKGRNKPHVVILDIMFPIRPEDEDSYRKLVSTERAIIVQDAMKAGIVLLGRIKSSLPEIPIIVYTNLSEETEIGKHILEQIRATYPEVEVLPKPQFINTIIDAIDKVLPKE